MIDTNFTQWITSIVTIAAFLISVVVKVRRGILYKIKREIGKERLLNGIMILNDLLNEFDVNELYMLLKEFKKTRKIEIDMKDTRQRLHNVMRLKDSFDSPKLHKLLTDYKSKQDTAAAVRNEKRFRKFTKDKNFDQALNVISESLLLKLKLQAITNKKRGQVDQIKQIMSSIKDQIPVHRDMRIDIEKKRKELERKNEIIEKNKQMEELHKTFKK